MRHHLAIDQDFATHSRILLRCHRHVGLQLALGYAFSRQVRSLVSLAIHHSGPSNQLPSRHVATLHPSASESTHFLPTEVFSANSSARYSRSDDRLFAMLCCLWFVMLQSCLAVERASCKYRAASLSAACLSSWQSVSLRSKID